MIYCIKYCTEGCLHFFSQDKTLIREDMGCAVTTALIFYFMLFRTAKDVEDGHHYQLYQCTAFRRYVCLSSRLYLRKYMVVQNISRTYVVKYRYGQFPFKFSETLIDLCTDRRRFYSSC